MHAAYRRLNVAKVAKFFVGICKHTKVVSMGFEDMYPRKFLKIKFPEIDFQVHGFSINQMQSASIHM